MRTSRKRTGSGGRWVWKSVAADVSRNSTGAPGSLSCAGRDGSRVAGAVLQPAIKSAASKTGRLRILLEYHSGSDFVICISRARLPLRFLNGRWRRQRDERPAGPTRFPALLRARSRALLLPGCIADSVPRRLRRPDAHGRDERAGCEGAVRPFDPAVAGGVADSDPQGAVRRHGG